MICSRRRRSIAGGLVALLVGLSPAALSTQAALRPGEVATGAAGHPLAALGARCPWTTAEEASTTPVQLADQVLARLTLSEKLGIVSLYPTRAYENSNVGVPRLCIPALTLQDGPNGIATGDTGVTQLPASLGVAASFDTRLAYRYGQVLGAEARAQGIDAVQGPNLNLDRVPMAGRAFEGYGEDPLLASEMGVADIEGIQSKGVMSDAKHYSAYTQETYRLNLNQLISERALQEIYLPPFRAAVQLAHVASIMCAFGQINYVYSCQSRELFDDLKAWGFQGFVRSDLGAVNEPVLAFRNGLDLIKPAKPAALAQGLATHRLSLGRLDGAVRRVLSMMFRFGLIQHPLQGTTHTRVYTPAHTAVALQAAEASIVLLKNRSAVLPLSPKDLRSVAVIGEDAYVSPMTAGKGSAYVIPPFVVTPLSGIRSALGRRVSVSYSPGVPANARLPLLPASLLAAGEVQPAGNVEPRHETRSTDPADLGVLNQPGLVSASVGTAIRPLVGRGWLQWSGTLRVPDSGIYAMSVSSSGDSWLSVDGQPLISSPGLHGPATWSAPIDLVGGRPYQLMLQWFHVGVQPDPRLGLADMTASIAKAAAAARRAQVAIVFANDYNEEGFDRPNLGLPGAQNQLISAVAAANRRTIVVLNTGGPVLMPWRSQVAAIVEAWYPGEEDGTAIAAMLTGRIDPAGRLPVTFPASEQQAVGSSPSSWPGIDARVVFTNEGIGYRYYETHHLKPMFPFGFGLDYTTFRLSHATLTPTPSGYRIAVAAHNTGARRGTAVVEAYLGFPPAAAEPPEQLVAFARATLGPRQSSTVDLTVPLSALQSFILGRFVTLRGTYSISLGQSSARLPIRLTFSSPAGS